MAKTLTNSEALLADALADLFPEGLTTEEERQRHGEQQRAKKLRGFQRAGRNGIDREGIANEAVWLRLEGLSFAQIGAKLGISAQTALVYVNAIEPTLREIPEITRRGGRPPGFGRLPDARLRALHRLYMDSGDSASEIARQVWRQLGYASMASARNSITAGWKRLGLEMRADFQGRRCEGIKAGTKPRRCRRPAMLGQPYCFMHAHPEAAKEHAAKMRKRSPLAIAA